MATNEPVRKRLKAYVRYSMTFRFSNEDAKQEFIASMERVRLILSRGKSKTLENVELFQQLFDMVHDEDHGKNHDVSVVQPVDDVPGHPNTQAMLANSGMIKFLL
jgi:hypothetical protein